ncbi:ABC-F family ATP-binding cassette domain-containing protein [uncultured Cedecea sp.]|uniref:ABC-F family ATP-binding cassette domain-containing protein n=1 Tax=uncultured Cedecea sp. TaxID=988762 RepID=UPI0026187E6E|nr:ABC-F family ATP-binding cassette domain-containing protein [uncultured Cedecea sp.]
MTNTLLTLEGVSLVLPDGKPLFSHINAQFDARHTGMVGRNGVGKSQLARILAGRVMPTSGTCYGSEKVRYLAQHLSPENYHTVAMLAGVDAPLAALARIEAGSTCQADFDLVADNWDIRQRLQIQLAAAGLDYLSPETATHRLSGGEAMRVALSGAMLSQPDFLILDEPTNHLDSTSREALMQQLACWPQGLLVISHDRRLLQQMERIVELSSLGLHSYGGNYDIYQQIKARETAAAMQQLEHLKTERKRQEQALRDKRERLEKRQSRGSRLGKEANQANILLGRQKARSEVSAGKQEKQVAESQIRLNQQVQNAAKNIEHSPRIVMHDHSIFSGTHQVARLSEITLPFAPAPYDTLDLTVYGGQRIGIRGPNGCGKSTLLRILAGQLSPVLGTCDIRGKIAYLDQQLSLLDPQQNVLTQLLKVNTQAGESRLRMQLAQLGLDATHVSLPCGQLSGGEQLKAALATVIYASPPASCLLLDEPSNHLDLVSLQALEQLLNQYSGTLLVVSHDDVFLSQIGLTHGLVAGKNGWELMLV